MGLLTHQLTGLTLLIVCRIFFGLLPLGIDSPQSSLSCVEFLSALFLSLAGGVLLATSFIHLIPQVRLALRLSLPHHALPVTELLVVAGFFFTFFLDEALDSFRSGSKKVHPEEDAEPEPAPAPGESPKSSKSGTKSKVTCYSVDEPISLPIAPRVALLSLQALAQGAALGLARTAGEVWFVATSSTVHGSASGMELTIRLLGNSCSPGVVALVAAFLALLSMTGFVAVALSREWIDEGLTALLRGLAAGSALYIAVYEALSRETRKNAMGLLAYFVTVMGFLVMFALQLWGLHEPNFEDELVVSICSQKTTTEEPGYDYSEGNS